MLGTNPFELVACINNYKKNDRERNCLYRSDIVDIFERIASNIDAPGALKMLEKMRKYWLSYPRKRIDIYSWSDTISILVRKISTNKECTNIFKEKYPNILCLKQVKTIDDSNKRKIAKEWCNSQKSLNYIFTKEIFTLLGYKTLEALCEEHGGFAENDSVRNFIEKNCFELLDQFSDAIFKDFFVMEKKPEIMVIRNNTSIAQGLACLTKMPGKHYNKCNIRIRYKLIKVYLKHNVFAEDKFHMALSTYIHELCHIFGGDASSSFSEALTYAMTILLVNSEAITYFEKQWVKIFKKDDTSANTLMTNSA